MAAVKKTAEDGGGIVSSGQHNLCLHRVPGEERFRHLCQRCFRGEQTQSLAFDEIGYRRHPLLREVIQRSAEQQLNAVVGAPWRMDDDLLRDDGVFGVQEQRLLRGKVPLLFEPRRAIGRAEFPEGGVPGVRIAQGGLRARGNQPTLHDFSEEAGSDQSLAMHSSELP